MPTRAPRRPRPHPALPGVAAVAAYGLAALLADGPGVCGEGEQMLGYGGLAVLVVATAGTAVAARRRGKGLAWSFWAALLCATLVAPTLWLMFFSASFGNCFVF